MSEQDPGKRNGDFTEVNCGLSLAEAKMEARTPDLAILDVMFPEDSTAGFTLARAMRHYNEKLKGIPILMLTAVNIKMPLGFSEKDIDDHWLPVSDFVEKPVDFDVLQSKVAALLKKAASGTPSEKTQ